MRLSSCEKALDELSLDGKLIRANGVLCNNRVISVILTRQERSNNQALNATSPKNKSHENINKNNDSDEPSLSQTETNDKPTIDSLGLGIELERKKGSITGATPKRKATRLPEDWEPSEADKRYAVEQKVNPDSTLEDFKDYWCSKATNATKLDWSRTWKSWCRKSWNKENGKTTDDTAAHKGLQAGLAELDELASGRADLGGFRGEATGVLIDIQADEVEVDPD
jgi:hypothetical protein